MGGPLYRFARLAGAPFRYKVTGLENLAEDGPAAVFVSNHLHEIGPIQIMLSFPIRLYPWVISEMVEPEAAPAYLYKDFTEPTLGIRGRAGMALSTLISKLSVPMLRDLGGIPVYRNNGSLKKTFELSMGLLDEGKSILIFPEDPLAEQDPATGIRTFLAGFAFLGHLYTHGHPGALGFYPLAVESNSRTIQIGGKETYDSSLDNSEATQKLAYGLERRVREMYASLAGR